MGKSWTLHVEDLGRIKEADVTVAPLTLFVGDNNSGKSYLMTLLYTLLKMRYTGLIASCKGTLPYQWCVDWIRTLIKTADEWSPITEDVCYHLEELLNIALERNLRQIARWAFQSDDVRIGRLFVTLPKTPEDADSTLRIRYEGTKEDIATRFHSFSIKYGYTETSMVLPFDGEDLFHDVLGTILEYLTRGRLTSWDLSKLPPFNIAFLPISRTGFLLIYRSLMQRAIDHTFRLSEGPVSPDQQLTLPCIDHLQDLIAVLPEDEGKNERYQGIIRFIEDEMIGGHIRVLSAFDGLPPVFMYRPASTDIDLPMQLSSGVVTELASLLLTLRYRHPFGAVDTLFIEEPETGLHPGLQRSMAQVLIRLANMGVHVFATTHSDTILQHINNMIKLHDLPQEQREEVAERYNFIEEDMISTDDIAMYQFDVDEDRRTNAKRLSYNKYGYIIPTFNDILHDLLEQTRATELDDEDGYDG